MPFPSDLNRPLALLGASTLWDAVGGGALVVACSGGPDSVGLARAASELLADAEFTQRFAKLPRLILWHLEHGIRADSAAETAFIDDLAPALRAEALIERAELGQRIADEGGNLEAEARMERYTRLLTLLRGQHNWRAVTGHHLDDQAETVLHHVVRGTHLSGLRGIAPVYRSVIFRPWLELRRSEIVDYLASRGQSYLTDPSNSDTGFTRNRLRHEVLPILTQINPSAIEHIARLASMARDAVETQHQELAELEVQVFNADELASWLPLLGWPAGYELHRVREGWAESGQLAAYAAKVLRERCSGLSSPEHEAIGEWALDPDLGLPVRDVTIDLPHPQLLTISTPPQNPDPVELFLKSEETISCGGLTIELARNPRTQWELFQRRDRHAWERLRPWPEALAALCASPPGSPAWECYLGNVELPLRLRTWRVGERMALAGGGSSTVGDLFTNAKLPEVLRPLWCVLADAHDNALWLPGIADGTAMRIEDKPQWLVRLQVT